MKQVCFFAAFASMQILFANKTVALGGMVAHFQKKDKKLIIAMEAPTKGWMAVGLNLQSSVMGMNWLMARIVDGKVETKDFYKEDYGLYKPDDQLGGGHHIQVLDHEQGKTHSYIKISIPYNTGDMFDLPLASGQQVWVTLAYSQSKDFYHRSVMQRNKMFQLP